MNPRLQPPMVRALLLTAALGLAGIGAWQVHVARGEAQRAKAVLAGLRAEAAQLARMQPAPDAAGTELLATAVAAAESDHAAARLALSGSAAGPLLAPPPAQPVDAWFALTAQADALRARAARAGVTVSPGEGFAFASYARGGPSAAEIPLVHRQRVIVQHLVESLLEARPHALLAVQRERPAGGLEGDLADFFSFDPRLALRRPGLVEGTAFRLEFTGQTATLRAFLQDLGAFRLPVIVRGIEVTPLPPAPPARTAGTGPVPVPIVQPGLSRFAVTVEHVAVLARVSP